MNIIDNVVIISAVQQSDSVIDTHLFFFRFFSHLDHHRILGRVPCSTVPFGQSFHIPQSEILYNYFHLSLWLSGVLEMSTYREWDAQERWFK